MLGVESIEPNSKNYFELYDLVFFPDYREGMLVLGGKMKKDHPTLLGDVKSLCSLAKRLYIKIVRVNSSVEKEIWSLVFH